MAWATWLVVHIFFLIGFRNRWGVFRQWAYTYLTFRDGVRLIVGSQDLPGWGALAPSSKPVTGAQAAVLPAAVADTAQTAAVSSTHANE